MNSNKSIEAVKSNNLFKGLDFASLNIPFDTKNFLEFKEGDLIYSSGQPSNFVYLLINGEVKVKLNSIKRLFFKSPNEFFGETEVMQKEQRSSSALANSDCLIYKIDESLVSKLLNDSSLLSGNLLNESKKEVIENKIVPAEPESVNKIPELNLQTGTLQVESINLVDIKPKYETSIDLDNIEIKPYEQEPDLDAFIQQKYLENDNKSLKSNMIDDPDDMTNWVISEGSLEEFSGKSKTVNSNFSASTPAKIFENKLGSGIDSKKPTLPQPSNDINKIAKDILDYLLQKTDSQIGAIYLFSQDSQMFEEIYQTNESIYKCKISIKDGITGIAAKQKEIKFAISFLNDVNYNQEIDRPNGFVGETLIVIPFVDDKNNLLGIAQIGSDETMFTKDEERKVKEYTNQCSKILQQSLAFGSKTSISKKSELSQISNFIMQDVKAPLLTIKHYSSILSRFDLPEEVKRVISLLSSQANSVIDLLQSSIDFSEKNSKTKLELVDFNEVMDNNLILLSDYVESRNVKLFKKLGEDAKIKVDTRKFYVACYYIARFACDMMKHGGNLYFSSLLEDTKVVLHIADGNKIDKNDLLEKVFDPGYTNSNGESLGLSLAIAKFNIESLNGSINLQSSESGTSYLISIPVSS